MNNKGFAITGMLYSVLIIFLVLIVTLLFNLQNRKTILDELKADAINAVENDNNYEYLLNEINSLKESTVTVNAIYPVGSVFISTNSTNPSNLFSGTEWEAYGQGRTLIGAGTGTDSNNTSMTFENGKTGGEYKHQLTINEMPAHNHSLAIYGQNIYYFSDAGGSSLTTPYYPNGQSAAFSLQTEYNGSDNSHNNIQPYITVYMWKRVS